MFKNQIRTQMKTKYSKAILLFIPLAGLLAGGCQKLNEDPKGSLTPGQYFQTQADMDAAVAAIYTQYTPDYSFGFTYRMTSYFGSDDLTTDPALNKEVQREFDELNGTASNADMVDEWQGPWAAIYDANNTLADYHTIPTPDAASLQAVQQSAGQALFLRAFGYYFLVRTYGALPLVLNVLDASARPQRDSVSVIYTAIINDLDSAIGWLPTTWPGQPGKCTQNAARSLLADVYLTMTGWPLNQTGNYAKAAAEADTVINSGQYSLLPDYITNFQTNNSVESIFGLQFNVSGGVPERSYGSTNVPIDEVALDGTTGWDDLYPEINFYLNAPKCLRTTETFYDTLKLLIPGTKKFNLVPWNSPLTHAGHPYYKKFRAGLVSDSVGDGVSETDTSILSIQPSTNKVQDYIRYPMVLLDYAEASDMASGGPTGAGYTAINLVRARAGEPPLTPGLSQTAFQDSVVVERAYEFAGENGMRWFDIVRFQLLPTILAARSPLENPITGTNLNNKYLAPIPTIDMNNDPNWVQNPGY
jgi:hypothetical protein